MLRSCKFKQLDTLQKYPSKTNPSTFQNIPLQQAWHEAWHPHKGQVTAGWTVTTVDRWHKTLTVTAKFVKDDVFIKSKIKFRHE